MSLTYGDRVKESTVTTGTGSYTLAGAVSSAYQSFSAAIGVGNTTYYLVTNGVDWEGGKGTLSDATTLARTTIVASSNGDAAVDWPAGTKIAICTPPADAIPVVDTDDGSMMVEGDITMAVTTGHVGLFIGSNSTSSARTSQIKKNYDSPYDFNIYGSTNTSAVPIYVYNDDGTAGARLTIDTAGDVGIGTVSPADKLEVKGAIYANVAATSYDKARIGTKYGYPGVWFGTNAVSPSLANYVLLFDEQSANAAILNAPSGFDIAFRINNISQMVLDQNGNLQLPVDSNEIQLGAAQDYTITWDGSDAVHTVSSGDFVFSGGNIGIGVQPVGRLDVENNYALSLRQGNATYYAGMRYDTYGGETLIVAVKSSQTVK